MSENKTVIFEKNFFFPAENVINEHVSLLLVQSQTYFRLYLYMNFWYNTFIKQRNVYFYKYKYKTK